MNHLVGNHDSTAMRHRVKPVAQGAHGADAALSLTVLYEDDATRQWAGEVCARVADLVGNEALQASWWRLSDLNEPAVLAGAVSTTLRADVIVIAVRASEGFPLPFYVWVDSWLPYKAPNGAALVALITLPEPPTVQLDRARTYLRSVAQAGRLDFLLEERKLPEEMTPMLLACDSIPAPTVSPAASTPARSTSSGSRKAPSRRLPQSAAA